MDPSEAKRVAREHRPTLRGRLVAVLTHTWAACRFCGEHHPCPQRSEALRALKESHGQPPTPDDWRVEW